MITITMHDRVGAYAENKDIAKDIRVRMIMPALEKKEEIELDFSDVDLATQSFIHALISDPIRRYGSEVLTTIRFKGCNELIQKIVTIVTDYMQEGA